MTSDPINDPKRLAALRASGLLDTPSDPSFDKLAQTWARMLNAPLALVSLVDSDRQFFKSVIGSLPEPYASTRQTPLTHSFCKHVVATGQPLIVEDARVNKDLKDNLAIKELGVIAYAGIPLTTPDGHVLGTLCFIDNRPRAWDIQTGSIVIHPKRKQTEDGR